MSRRLCWNYQFFFHYQKGITNDPLPSPLHQDFALMPCIKWTKSTLFLLGIAYDAIYSNIQIFFCERRLSGYDHKIKVSWKFHEAPWRLTKQLLSSWLILFLTHSRNTFERLLWTVLQTLPLQLFLYSIVLKFF